DAIVAAENGWQTLKEGLTLDWQRLNLSSQMPIPGELDTESVNRFQTAMDDDLNTAAGLAVLFELAKILKREFNLRCHQGLSELTDIQLHQRSQTLTHLAQILGLEVQSESIPEPGVDVAWVEALLQQRQQARQEKRYAESDRIRNELQAVGITLIDQPDGQSRWHRS
ncbi:MAG: DALR domain-containing protein, partial [Leptodesmis sp.]|uniref:DALR domain-containing protein n=1 Tax=Leptodesmis sp. TaxID=3100501 RepID=UPI003D0EF6A3